MRQYIFIILLLGLSSSLSAQYYAYSMNGEVRLMRGGEWQKVYSSMELQENDLIQTEEYGNLTILDRTNNKMFSVQTVEAKPISQLMQTQKETKSLTAEYIIGMYQMLFGGERPKGTTPGVTYRGEAEEREIARALLHTRKSSFPISFTLLDLHTLEPVEQVREGQLIVVQFNNMSDTPLYMNIMDTEASGQQTAIFPLNEKQTLLTLYIPAFSNVRLHDYPITFAPGGTTDKLTLVAYPYPYDLRNVIDKMYEPDIRNATKHITDIGIFQQTISISK